ACPGRPPAAPGRRPGRGGGPGAFRRPQRGSAAQLRVCVGFVEKGEGPGGGRAHRYGDGVQRVSRKVLEWVLESVEKHGIRIEMRKRNPYNSLDFGHVCLSHTVEVTGLNPVPPIDLRRMPARFCTLRRLF